MAIDPAVVDMALRNGGVVRRHHLIEAGFSRHWIDREVRARRLRVIKPGYYRVLDMNGDLDLIKAAALVLPNAVVSHESAAHLLKFPKLPRFVPSVTVHPRTTHIFPNVVVHRADDITRDHLVRVGNLAVTSLQRTLFDLAGVLQERHVDEIVEALVLEGRLDLPRFATFTGTLARRGKPGVSTIVAILERRLESRPATELERRGLALILGAGLAEPAREYPAPWDPDKRLDLAWPPSRLAVEWDSRSWHLAIQQMVEDRDRDRKALIAGWTIVRFTWWDVMDRPEHVIDQLRLLLAQRSA